MGKGRIWPAEGAVYADRVSGVEVRRLTGYLAHSHHLYFTNPGWYDEGRTLLIASERENAPQLYGVDLDLGELRQLTDASGVEPGDLLGAALNPVQDEAYVWRGEEVVALDLATLEERCLYRRPEGFLGGNLSVSADGRFVCGGLREDLADRIDTDLLRGYVGFEAYCRARPLCRIVTIPVDGSRATVVHEDRCWIGHVNTSPTQANLLTFCHEGPWQAVDHRIWGMDLETDRIWPIRPHGEKDDRVGHEYWHADGEHIGYHGESESSGAFFGQIRYDNSGRQEVAFPHPNVHVHSNGGELIVGDDTAFVTLYARTETGYAEPRVLCAHRSSMHIQQTHVHPRLAPDGDAVLFTSDTTGYGQVYLAPIPALDDLPTLASVQGAA